MADCYLTGRHRTQPALARTSGLCLGCERHGRHAIRELVHDYELLVDELVPLTASQASAIFVKRTEAPLPLREGVDDIMREIHWTLSQWAMQTAIAVRITRKLWRGTKFDDRVREASAILDTHYEGLLSIADCEIIDYHTIDYLPAHGLYGVGELIRVHARARSILGLPPHKELRILPCPAPPLSDGCGEYKLYTLIGSGATGEPNTVRCDNCGWTCNADQYAAYASLDFTKAFT